VADLKKKFKAILEDIEKNIKNKEDLEYIKSQMYNISLLFLDEIDKIAELNLGRINVMLEREKELARKIGKMEKIIENIEREVFISPESDFEIICPYCNAEFVEDLSKGIEEEVKCPECGNTIELDWHEEGCSHHHCGECGGECDDCEDDFAEYEEEYEDELEDSEEYEDIEDYEEDNNDEEDM